MRNLNHKLAPFLRAENTNNTLPATTSRGQSQAQGRGLGAEYLAGLEHVHSRLLEVRPGEKSTRHIRAVLDTIEQGARAAGILPPRDNVGWVWSLAFDDWFIWDAGEGAFVSAKNSVRTDFVAA
jgi:hypothetical protein